jgi:serine/threonine protein kinase/tetratricopeptide (TPR) repeat protein
MTTPKRWQEVDRIFAVALEREPSERAAFLDEACAGDELLREEVESLLANDVPESLGGANAVEEATRLLEQRSEEPPTIRIGRYRITRVLGSGGMGRVYLGQDEQLTRQVAVKVLSNYDASEKERMRRFVLEAKAAAALNHPNIAHIYEISEDKGTNFIAMEFVDGETLRQKIRGKSELKTLLKYLLQVAEGLAKAHAAGIVHRDLKPDNIMITQDGHAKILDFGLAKLIGPTGQNPGRHDGTDASENRPGASENPTAMMPVHSTPGLVMGTVGYLSPEQAQAKSVDQRSDIFSFGCILYEVATGRKPFAGDSVIETLHKIIYEPAPSITDINPSASPGLQRVIRKCLAKEPEKRYQTIRDTANDLEELMEEMKGVSDIDRSVAPSTSATTSCASSITDNEARARSTGPISHQSTSPAAGSASGVKQHRLAIVSGLLLLLVAAVALILYQRAPGDEVAIDSIAVLPFQNRSTETDTEYLSDGLTESLIYRLSQLPDLKVSPTTSVFRYKGKEIDPIKVGQELGVSAVLSGRIVQRGDNLTISAELLDVGNNRLLWGEQYERKLSELLATQREIAREIVEKLKLKVSGEERLLAKHYTESNEAYQLYLKGRFYWNKRTAAALRKSIEYFNQAIEKDPGFALAYAGLADCYAVPANRLPPREVMPKAKAAAMRALELDETLAEAHTSLARVYSAYDWNWTSAEKGFKRAIELNPNYATAHQFYGDYLEATGRPTEAIAEEKRALELDPLSLVINFELGMSFYYAHDFDQAIEQFQKTLELDQNFPLAREFLPASYEQKGMYAEAIAGFKDNTSRGVDESKISITRLGRVYALSGKKHEARAILDELKQLSAQHYLPADAIALVYAGLGEKDQAFAWLEKAYEERAFRMQFIKVEPKWDSLRSDPRFADLLRRIGLPQ